MANVLRISLQNNLIFTNTKYLFVLKYTSNRNLYKTNPYRTEDVVDIYIDNRIEKRNIKATTNKLKAFFNSFLQKENTQMIIPKRSILYNQNNEELNNLLMNNHLMKNYETILEILHYCNNNEKIIKEELLKKILFKFAENGNIQGVTVIRSLLQKQNQELFDSQGRYVDYEATALWINGNLSTSFLYYYEIFENYPYLRFRISSLMRLAFKETIMKKSESSLVIMTRFVKNLCRDFNNYYPMFHLWQETFLSKWYHDWLLADSLLEEHEQLRDLMKNRIWLITYKALNSNDIDALYRLIEILLRYNYKSENEIVFRKLFDYQYLQRNFEACNEIVKASIRLDVSLTDFQHQKYMDIVMQKDIIDNSRIPLDQIVIPDRFLWKF